MKKNLGKQTRLLGNISASTKTVGANPTPPVSEHARAPPRFFWKHPSPAASQPANLTKPGKPTHTSGACETGSAKTHPPRIPRRAKRKPPRAALASAAGQPPPHSGVLQPSIPAGSSRNLRVPRRDFAGLVFWWTRRWWGSRGRGKNWSRWSTASPTSPFPAPPPRAADWLVVELVFVHFFTPFSW